MGAAVGEGGDHCWNKRSRNRTSVIPRLVNVIFIVF